MTHSHYAGGIAFSLIIIGAAAWACKDAWWPR
jgi:hypothetical protein